MYSRYTREIVIWHMLFVRLLKDVVRKSGLLLEKLGMKITSTSPDMDLEFNE